MLCSGSTTSCLPYGQKAAMRPHICRRVVRALQEAGRAPSSLLLSIFLWRAEQQSHFNLQGLKSSMPRPMTRPLCCAVAASCLNFRTAKEGRRCGLTCLTRPSECSRTRAAAPAACFSKGTCEGQCNKVTLHGVLLPGLKSSSPSLSNSSSCAVQWRHYKLPSMWPKCSGAASHLLQGRQSAPGARQSPLQRVIEQVPVRSHETQSLF